MSAECERVRELAPELALGIADGEERAWALEHLADCAACRAHVERLSGVADELVHLAPAVEPPPGFDGRVAGGMAPAPAREPRPRRWAIPALAALAAAAAAALAVWVALDDDRDLADSYRDTLAVANGEYFDAASMAVPGGEEVGYVYGYQGRASWVLVVLYDGVDDGKYEVELVTEEGRNLPFRELEIEGGNGSIGAVTPVAYHRLAEVRVLDGMGREVADSELRE
jgi:Putative zinc-finger